MVLAECPHVDVNWQDSEGNTALITAAQAGKTRLCLLEAGGQLLSGGGPAGGRALPLNSAREVNLRTGIDQLFILLLSGTGKGWSGQGCILLVPWGRCGLRRAHCWARVALITPQHL